MLNLHKMFELNFDSIIGRKVDKYFLQNGPTK